MTSHESSSTVTPTSSLPSANTGESSVPNSSVILKMGIIGDAQIGKTSLMIKYAEGAYDTEYTQTLGVNFMEKTVVIRQTEITFSIWDLGGQKEFASMMPLVCGDAVAILFTFDLARKSTLNNLREWYRQARGLNKSAIPVLVGTKYDEFVDLAYEDQDEITRQARKYSRAMKAPLVFCSTAESINVQKIYKIVLAKVFDLTCTLPEVSDIGGPIVEYKHC